jgi:hypothetical protein
MKASLILPAILLALPCTEFASLAFPWITTNPPPRILTGPTESRKDWDVTLSVLEAHPAAKNYNNESARLLLHREERLTWWGYCPGTTVTNFDLWGRLTMRGVPNSMDIRGMTRSMVFNACSNSQVQFSAEYSRGPLFAHQGGRWVIAKWITVFFSDDQRRLVLAEDGGGVLYTEDAGSTWRRIKDPGRYEFTLSRSQKGSALIAALSVTNGASVFDAAQPGDTTAPEWYSELPTTDHNAVVISGSATQTAPLLKLTRTATQVTVSWSTAFTGYGLEENNQATTVNWLKVTNPSIRVGDQFQVFLPATAENRFFRLSKP